MEGDYLVIFKYSEGLNGGKVRSVATFHGPYVSQKLLDQEYERLKFVYQDIDILSKDELEQTLIDEKLILKKYQTK